MRLNRDTHPVAEPNVEVRDAIRIACDLEDSVTQVSQCCGYHLRLSRVQPWTRAWSLPMYVVVLKPPEYSAFLILGASRHLFVLFGAGKERRSKGGECAAQV